MSAYFVTPLYEITKKQMSAPQPFFRTRLLHYIPHKNYLKEKKAPDKRIYIIPIQALFYYFSFIVLSFFRQT